jgi:hypothetical protein
MPAAQGGAGYHPPCAAGISLSVSASIQTLGVISHGLYFGVMWVSMIHWLPSGEILDMLSP